MVAISDVARAAGVSKATASRALSGSGSVSSETRARVVKAAEDLGYVASPIAASLATGKTWSVAVIVPRISDWYLGRVLDGVEEALLEQCYDMTVHRLRPSTERRGRPLDFVLARRRFDGVIAVGIEPGERDRSLLRNLDVPIVAAGSAIDGFPSHRIDDTAVGRRATEHLIALGHRRIAHLGGPFSETLPDSAHGRRLHGYLDAMSAAGLEPMATFPVAALTVPTGYEAGVDLLARSGPRPTAVFAACDEGAIGVIVAARHLGLEVPAELSVIGIDGHEYAEMFGLTTFEQQPRQQGSDAASTLLSIFDGADAPVDIPPVLTRLAVRSSTTPPRRT